MRRSEPGGEVNRTGRHRNGEGEVGGRLDERHHRDSERSDGAEETGCSD